MTFTLVSDGGSDRAMIPLLTWCLREQGIHEINPQWADPYRMPRARSLGERLEMAFDLFPCDVFFIHRDAEREEPEVRREEIRQAATFIEARLIPVVPVRMMEAWLLCDPDAIRRVAGNPNGKEILALPALERVEDLPDPKQVLHNAILAASELNTRRRRNLSVGERVHRLASEIENFAPLRALAAFRSLEDDVAQFVSVYGS